MKQILNIAVSDDGIKSILNKTAHAKFINYILPCEWYAAEIPMNGIRYRAGHLSPSDYDDNKYKIIFTTAEIRGNTDAIEKSILTRVLERKPIVEVWVDLNKQAVVQKLEIPADYKYHGIPVAVY